MSLDFASDATFSVHCMDSAFPSSLCVLIVEDDKATRLLTARVLESAGLPTRHAADGTDALSRVMEAPEEIGVIVLDVLLPSLGGFQVLEVLKSDRRTRDIPVVLLTAKANQEADVIRGIQVGADDHVQKPFNDKVLAAKVRALCERRRESLELARRLRQAEELAATDALTGLGNRRAFEKQLEVELAFSERHRLPLGLLVLDIDQFKPINDRFGHPAGDAVLIRAADRIRASLRSSDQAYRLGGDEFGVLLRDCGELGAQLTGERILKALVEEPVTLESGEVLTVSSSIGGAVVDAANGYRSERVVARADQALYAAKLAGRGRVTVERYEPGAGVSGSPATSAPAISDE